MNATTTRHESPAVLSKKTHALLWKEWRERRGLITLGMLIFVIAPLAGLALTRIQNYTFGYDAVQLWLWIGLVIGLVLIGASFMSSEENDATHCWLYSLPVSRTRIALVRLSFLNSISIVLAAAVLVAWFRFGRDANRVGLANLYMTQRLLLALSIVPVASAIRTHIAQPIVAWVLCAVLAGALAFLSVPGSVATHVQILLAAVILSAWVVALISRTRVQELAPLSRATTGLLYLVTIAEAGILYLFADPYELFLLLTGGF